MEFAYAVLRELGVTMPKLHVAARRGLVIIMIAESGSEPCDGKTGARYNPLNTELFMPGSTRFNSAGVQNYTSFNAGVLATTLTLEDGFFADLDAVLANPLVRTKTVVEAWGDSAWGTSLDTALAAYDRYQTDRGFFNRLTVGP